MSRWRASLCGLALALAATISGPGFAATQTASTRCSADAAGDDVSDLLADMQSPRAFASAPDLFKALAARQPAHVQRLLKGGADARQCHRGVSMLSLAAMLGEDDALRMLVQAVGHPDAVRDSDGGSALLSALGRGRFGTAAQLLRQGADPLLRTDRGLGSLHQLAMAGPAAGDAWVDEQVNLARQLAARGVAVDTPDPQGGNALLLATVQRNTALAGWLLSKGADPDLVNQRGTSAQALAQRQGNTVLLGMFDRARLLRPLRQGRNADFVAQLAGCGGAGHPVSPAVATELLLPAMAFRQADVTRALLACGADANARSRVDSNGEAQLITPLVYAAGDLGSLQLVQALLDSGADATAPSQRPDGSALTLPQEAARKAGHHDIARLLAARAARPGR